MNIIKSIKEKQEINKLKKDMDYLVNNGFDGFSSIKGASKYLEKRNNKVKDVKEKLQKYPNLFSKTDMYFARNYIHEVNFKTIKRNYDEMCNKYYKDSWYKPDWNEYVANYLTDLQKATVEYITREEEY